MYVTPTKPLFYIQAFKKVRTIKISYITVLYINSVWTKTTLITGGTGGTGADLPTPPTCKICLGSYCANFQKKKKSPVDEMASI